MKIFLNCAKNIVMDASNAGSALTEYRVSQSAIYAQIQLWLSPMIKKSLFD